MSEPQASRSAKRDAPDPATVARQLRDEITTALATASGASDDALIKLIERMGNEFDPWGVKAYDGKPLFVRADMNAGLMATGALCGVTTFVRDVLAALRATPRADASAPAASSGATGTTSNLAAPDSERREGVATTDVPSAPRAGAAAGPQGERT